MTKPYTILTGFYTIEQGDFLKTRTDTPDVLVKKDEGTRYECYLFDGDGLFGDALDPQPVFNLTDEEYEALYADQYNYDDPSWS